MILHEIIEDNLSSNTTTWNVSKEDDKGSVAKKKLIVKTVWQKLSGMAL